MTVHATDPPSMQVIVVMDDPTEPHTLELDVGDLTRDRIDLIFDLDGQACALRGNVANGAQAMFPEPPDPPEGARVLAQVRVKAEAECVFDADITRFNEGVMVTGENRIVDPNLVLDPNDPFERLLIPMIELQRRKRQDYASNGNMYANFDKNAAALNLPGYGPLEDCLSMVTRKVGRVTNLRGREPQNESLQDSYMDLAIYSILLYGLSLREIEKPVLGTHKAGD